MKRSNPAGRKSSKTRRPSPAKYRLVVPFHDVDSLGVVWHGHYFKYFEMARTLFFRRLGFDVPQMKKTGYVWPVIESHCRYVGPLRYGMSVEVRARLVDFEHRIKFVYTIVDRTTGRRLTTGHTVQAAVKERTGELCLTTPSVLARRLR